MPVRDDWTSAAELIRRLDRAVHDEPFSLEIMIVDDGSLRGWQSAEFGSVFNAIRAIGVLRLRRNLGHQRAIAVGLGYVQQNLPCDAVMVMDGDGEDTPSGAVQLLRAFGGFHCAVAVFAERVRRSESLQFRISYHLYRFVHWILTGVKVRVGNFSILPFRYLDTLAVLPELWNHYAAAIFVSRLAFKLVPVPRGFRIDGASQMNFVSLVAHGLSAISVFGDKIGVRMLIASLGGSALVIAAIVIVLAVRIFSHLAIPGWATYAVGTLTIILIQLIAMATSFTFFMLSNRMNLGFVPVRDYKLFVAERTDIYRDE